MPTRAVRAAPRRAWIADRGGNIAILTALILPVLIGACGLGAEIGYWFYSVREMQNAADSAAVAAATNGSSSYATEAQAVSSLYGYQNGVGEVTVSASDAAACPSGGDNCYSVTITKRAPLFMAQVVGFKGTTTVQGVPYTQLTATATAAVQATGDACVLVLDPSDPSAATNTGGDISLSNCDLQVNSSSSQALTVTGGVIDASGINVVGGYQSTGGTLNPTPATGKPTVSDPYAALYSQNDVASIGSQSCTSKSIVGGSATLSPGNYCSISITGATVTLEPGQYNIMGGSVTLTGGSLTGSGVTFVMTNHDGGSSYGSLQLTGGVIDLTAPTSGEWAGMLIYQDPNTPKGTLTSLTGSSSTYTGVLYFPTETLDYTGASTASPCTQLVVYKLTFTGGSTIGNNCAGTGVQDIPVGGGRGKLVS